MTQNPTLIIKGSNYPIHVYHHVIHEDDKWGIKTVIRATFDGSLKSREQAIFATPGKGKIVLHGSATDIMPNEIIRLMGGNGPFGSFGSFGPSGYPTALFNLVIEIKKALADGRLSYRDDDVKKAFPV